MRRRVEKKMNRRKGKALSRAFRRLNGACDRATFKARHGHWPGEYASPHIGHISGFMWFSNPAK